VEDWLTAAARARPDQLALVADEGSLTYAELDERADRRAREVAGAGVGVGDRVSVTHPPGIAFAELLHALPRLGAVLEPGPPADAPVPVARACRAPPSCAGPSTPSPSTA
jgi:non-ribosomal peptide synthetase component E (peptide arylation enzyme)